MFNIRITFFIIRGQDVRLSRSPADFAEYLQLHSVSLPALADTDEIDSRQMQFGWGDEKPEWPPEVKIEP